MASSTSTLAPIVARRRRQNLARRKSRGPPPGPAGSSKWAGQPLRPWRPDVFRPPHVSIARAFSLPVSSRLRRSRPDSNQFPQAVPGDIAPVAPAWARALKSGIFSMGGRGLEILDGQGRPPPRSFKTQAFQERPITSSAWSNSFRAGRQPRTRLCPCPHTPEPRPENNMAIFFDRDLA